jgi:hypothetical protein
MKIKHVKRAIKKVKKFFRIERFLCYFDIESSVSLVSVFTAIPCCILSYHDAVFLFNYMSERNDEETSGMRSLDGEAGEGVVFLSRKAQKNVFILDILVYEFWKWVEVAIYLIAIMSSFAVPSLIRYVSMIIIEEARLFLGK